jgi:hypothetical protein
VKDDNLLALVESRGGGVSYLRVFHDL